MNYLKKVLLTSIFLFPAITQANAQLIGVILEISKSTFELGTEALNFYQKYKEVFPDKANAAEERITDKNYRNYLYSTCAEILEDKYSLDKDYPVELYVPQYQSAEERYQVSISYSKKGVLSQPVTQLVTAWYTKTKGRTTSTCYLHPDSKGKIEKFSVK